MSKRMEIEADTELGRKLLDIKLDYFSHLAGAAMHDLSDEKREQFDQTARAYSMALIESLNEIESARERFAVAAMVAVDFATSLYMTIDEAVAAMAIEDEFGGGSRD